MSMPIQTQSAQYAAFEGDSAVYARRDVATFEIDADVHDYLAGPSIQGGLLDTRQAVNTQGMPPESHAYAGEVPYGPEGIGGQSREYNPYSGYEPTGADEQAQEAVGEDDASGYNWGPDPSRQSPGSEVYDWEGNMAHGLGLTPHRPDESPGPDFHGDAPHPPGTPVYNPRSSPYDNITGGRSFSSARRHQADGGPDFGTFAPNMYQPGDRLRGESELFGAGEPEGESPHWVTGQTVLPAQPAAPGQPVWLGHTYAPGHRVGLPWRGADIPGTVTHLDGTQVGVRWDDGQHSVEEPGDIRPLHQR